VNPIESTPVLAAITAVDGFLVAATALVIAALAFHLRRGPTAPGPLREKARDPASSDRR
jgi:hypothetical protein